MKKYDYSYYFHSISSIQYPTKDKGVFKIECIVTIKKYKFKQQVILFNPVCSAPNLIEKNNRVDTYAFEIRPGDNLIA